MQENKPSIASPNLATIVLVGRTNVGKSTLFNRLTRSRRALVAPSPGLTRDRREGEVTRGDIRFRLIDTGGLSLDTSEEFAREITHQAEVAMEQADMVWLVTTATDGLTALDEEIYRNLKKHKAVRDKPLLAVVNKVDNWQRESALSEFYRLGTDSIFPISALHGKGIDDLLQESAVLLPNLATMEQHVESDMDDIIRVAFLGKPNVGKSSLVNRILGEGRMIVSEKSGTTREPIDTRLHYGKQDYLLIDTAGIRRKAKTTAYLDKLGAMTALGALYRTDVAVLVLDADDDVSDQDAKIAGAILERNRGVVIAVNKWDRIQDDSRRIKAYEGLLQRKLGFLEFAPRVSVSATEGFGVDQLFREVQKVFTQYVRSIQTADLNRVIPLAIRQHPPPRKGRSETRILYGSQIGVRPPVFRLFTSHPERITPAYSRYFANQIRYHFGFRGVPLLLEWKGRGDNAPRNRKPRTDSASAGPAE